MVKLVSSYVFWWFFNVVGVLSTNLFQLQVVGFVWEIFFLLYYFPYLILNRKWFFLPSKPMGKLKFQILPLNDFFTDFDTSNIVGAVHFLSACISSDRINCGTSDLFVFILSLGTIGYESISNSYYSSLFVPMVRLFTRFEEIYFDDYRLLPNRFLYDGFCNNTLHHGSRR